MDKAEAVEKLKYIGKRDWAKLEEILGGSKVKVDKSPKIPDQAAVSRMMRDLRKAFDSSGEKMKSVVRFVSLPEMQEALQPLDLHGDALISRWQQVIADSEQAMKAMNASKALDKKPYYVKLRDGLRQMESDITAMMLAGAETLDEETIKSHDPEVHALGSLADIINRSLDMFPDPETLSFEAKGKPPGGPK